MTAATKQVSGVLRTASAAVRKILAAGDSTRGAPVDRHEQGSGFARHYGPITVAWSGSLELRDRQVECIVTRISAAGATVQVSEPVVCLISIVLHCPRLEPCRARIVWRRENLLGLRFLEKPQKIAWALGQAAFGPAVSLLDHGTEVPSMSSRHGGPVAACEHLNETPSSTEDDDERSARSVEDELVKAAKTTSADNGSVRDRATTSGPTPSNRRSPTSPAEGQLGAERCNSDDLWGNAGPQFTAALAEVHRRAVEALQAAEQRRIEETAVLSAALTSQEKAHVEMLSRARDAEAGRLAEAERRWQQGEAERLEAVRQQWEQEKQELRAEAERERAASEQRMAAAVARWRQEEAQRFAAAATRWQAKAERLESTLATLKSETETKEQKFRHRIAEMRAETESNLRHAQAEWQKETARRLAEAESAIRAVFEQALAAPGDNQ